MKIKGFINSGSLTVINCAKNIIVVGTSKGLILAFSLDDEFLWIVHDDSSNDQGGISAIAVTPVQEDKLLIGYVLYFLCPKKNMKNECCHKMVKNMLEFVVSHILSKIQTKVID